MMKIEYKKNELDYSKLLIFERPIITTRCAAVLIKNDLPSNIPSDKLENDLSAKKTSK